MNLQRLEIFVDVARTLSFAQAAKALEVDPSLVSRSIAQLEKELGVQLFFRTTRRMAMTEAGKSMFSRIQPLLEELRNSAQQVSEHGKKIDGVLRVTCSNSIGIEFLADLISPIQTLHSKLRFEAIVTDQIVDLVNERIDVALRMGTLPDSVYYSKKLVPLEYCVVCSIKTLKSSSVKIPADLEQQNCCTFLLPGVTTKWKYRKSKEVFTQETDVGGTLRSSSALTLKKFALSGKCFALLPKLIVSSELQSGALVQVLSDYEWAAVEYDSYLWAVYPDRQFLPKKTRLFLERCELFFRDKRT
jgi:DNA-binding transcriptional LysR family regulator